MKGFAAGCVFALATAVIAVSWFAGAGGEAQSSSSADGHSSAASAASATAPVAFESPMHAASGHLPFEFGVLGQGGVGLTEDRDSFRFLMVGVHAGKVLYRDHAKGIFRGNFEYAGELFPYWEALTPSFDRANCTAIANSTTIQCSAPYKTGGNYHGITVTPIILRFNFRGTRRLSPWVQAAGGLLWTNHKFPAFGSSTPSLAQDGPNTEASVFNFTPQGGVGFHYFIKPTRSIDFSANGIHISSASLGDKNPGVNASVQFSLGYTFWK